MKGLLSWVKGHLLIVISVLLILILLPAGFVGAGMWNAKIKDEAEKAYKDQERQLTAQERVQYALPAVFEGEQAVELSRAPNRHVTSFFAEQKQQRQEQVAEIVERATEFNRAEHEVLVEGLFPEAPSERAERDLVRNLTRSLAGDDRTVSAYDALVRRLGGGLPPEPEEVAAIMIDAETKALERRGVFEGSNDRLEPEEEADMRDELSAQRIGIYAGHAGDLTFYVVPGLFDAGASGAASEAAISPRPTYDPAAPVAPLSVAFTWQWDYWAVEDVLRAIARANEGVDGRPVGVPDALIKRVDSIQVGQLVLPQADSSGGGRSGFSSNAAGPKTYTGRLSEPSSEYDVRMVYLDVVASPRQLPAFIDALASTGFMTVTDLDIVALDPWEEIEAGYYFGSEPVARVRLAIETVWLRAWTGPLMPPSVREALGVTLPQAEDETAEDEGP
ncbi:MAG: hypothetical protein RIB60_06270 [Phycisphaerales bacterium]